MWPAILTMPVQRSNKSKPHQKEKNSNNFRDSLPDRTVLSFSARPLCLRSVLLHINHDSARGLGESLLACGLLSLTFLSPRGTMWTLRVILCDGYQLAPEEAMQMRRQQSFHPSWIMQSIYEPISEQHVALWLSVVRDSFDWLEWFCSVGKISSHSGSASPCISGSVMHVGCCDEMHQVSSWETISRLSPMYEIVYVELLPER